MTSSLVFDKSSFANSSAENVGGKAWRLLQLSQSGISVPEFFVVSADAFSHTVALSDLDGCEQDVSTVAAEMRRRIETATLKGELVSAVEAAYEASFSTSCTVAVRSSAVVEDGSSHSFAGMYESVLGVRCVEDLLSAIRQVWSSAFSPRVIAYRQHHGLTPLDPRMAVIVQQMIDADCSGVCFTQDPSTGSGHQILINALPGLGEGLVSLDFPADSYRIDRDSLAIHAEVCEKPEQLELDHQAGGVRRVRLSPSRRSLDSLNQQQILEVVNAGLAIESIFGEPQDVEFCFGPNGCLCILQSRPITSRASQTAEEQLPPGQDNRMIWDNSNIIESYSGVTTPMTFSFIRRAYSIVYHCFANVMGISPQVVEQHRDTFDNMLGLFHGRVYYNLKNWYRLVRMFPGYDYNRGFMESMMGVRESFSLEDVPEPVSVWRRWLVEFPALLRLFLRSGWNFLRIRSIVERFEEHFYHHHDQWAKIDFDRVPPYELARMFDVMERQMLSNWQAPIINDFYVMVFYGILRKMCTGWCGDESASLQNGLLCGQGGLRSDEPAKMLMHMTELVGQDRALKDLVLNEPLESLPNRIASDGRFAEFNQRMASYLDQFGLRCADELKLEAYSYRDQPHRLYQLIRNYLTANNGALHDLESMKERESIRRKEAECEVEARLAQSRSWVPRRLLFYWVLENARLGVRNRENMRFARTRIYGILRQMLRSIGRQLADHGTLDDREDIFYLTIDEVWCYVKGTAVSTDLRGLAKLRKAEYDRYRRETDSIPADRFETFSLPYLADIRVNPPQTAVEDGRLRGVGCCPGVVRGVVQVVRDPLRTNEFSGDILVAERTDPGWVALYPAFAGILVERGSVLSHSAIVAREMGIPMIVRIPGLTQRVQSGQQVVMDGHTGCVQVEEERVLFSS